MVMFFKYLSLNNCFRELLLSLAMEIQKKRRRWEGRMQIERRGRRI